MANIFGLALPVIYVHLGALLFLFIVILIADKQVFSWIKGKKETLSLKILNKIHLSVWIGLVVMILTGVLMAVPLSSYLFQEPSFYIKMLFVLALIVNSFFISKFMKVASEKSFANLTDKEKFPILVSGGVSTASWIGAVIAALYMTSSNWLLQIFSFVF